MVPLRSSSCLSPDLVFQAFSFPVHDLSFWAEPPKVVWNLLLQAGSEGPSLIGQTVAHSNSLLAALVLVAHYCPYPGRSIFGSRLKPLLASDRLFIRLEVTEGGPRGLYSLRIAGLNQRRGLGSNATWSITSRRSWSGSHSHSCAIQI